MTQLLQALRDKTTAAVAQKAAERERALRDVQAIALDGDYPAALKAMGEAADKGETTVEYSLNSRNEKVTQYHKDRANFLAEALENDGFSVLLQVRALQAFGSSKVIAIISWYDHSNDAVQMPRLPTKPSRL